MDFPNIFWLFLAFAVIGNGVYLYKNVIKKEFKNYKFKKEKYEMIQNIKFIIAYLLLLVLYPYGFIIFLFRFFYW